MRSLLELISQHSDANAIVPLIAIVAVIVIILIYSFVKPKWVKYLVSAISLVIGLTIFFRGYKTMLEPAGLSLIIAGTKFLVFGIVALSFSLIMDILDSLAVLFKKNESGKKDKNKKKDKTEKDLDIDKEETKLIKNKINEETTEVSRESLMDETTIIPDIGLIGDDTKIIDNSEIEETTEFLIDEDKNKNYK